MITAQAAVLAGRTARRKRLAYMTGVDHFLDTLEQGGVDKIELLPLLDLTTKFYQGYLTGLRHI